MSILMALGTPYATVLHGSGPLESDELDNFFEGIHECCERWLQYLQLHVGDVSSRYDAHSPTKTLYIHLKDMYENDDWTVFESRSKARTALLGFEHLCSDMARSFSHPPRVKEFYHNLSSRARCTFESLVEGEF